MSTLSRIVLPSAWLLTIGAGFSQIWRYETTPGSGAAPRVVRPNDGRVALDPARTSVLIFVHPACPCTRASLEGLAGLVGKVPERTPTFVVVVGEGGSTNVAAARRIPGAKILFDPKGTEAARFGAQTSGQTMAIAPNGRVLFQGGLTSFRGHLGPSSGLSALASILRGERPETRSSPVYGCALGPSEATR